MSNEILLIHLGGLGDICLSASTFRSCHTHFGSNIHAVGYKRFLGLFDFYFGRVLSIEERSWLWLFADIPCDKRWSQTVLIGKDKSGDLRRRLSTVSPEPPLFIDLYPEQEKTHVEAYQLSQIRQSGITPLKQEIDVMDSQRIILYPERGFAKKKWPYELFIELYHRLKDKELDIVLLEAPDLHPSVDNSIRFEDLKELTHFLREGGLFFSNDSGMAHLASTCGLATITLFWDHDPAVWHPRGRNTSLQCSAHAPTVEEMLSLILEVKGQA